MNENEKRSTEPKTEAERHETHDEKKTFVDTFFDKMSVQTAKGLVLTKGALEVLARWLEARAKDAGELATKLSSTSPEGSRSAEPTTEPSA